PARTAVLRATRRARLLPSRRWCRVSPGRRRPAAPQRVAARRVMTAVSAHKLASVLLQYPTMALFSGVGVLEAEAAALSRPTAAAFGQFLGWLAVTRPGDVATHY